MFLKTNFKSSQTWIYLQHKEHISGRTTGCCSDRIIIKLCSPTPPWWHVLTLQTWLSQIANQASARAPISKSSLLLFLCSLDLPICLDQRLRRHAKSNTQATAKDFISQVHQGCKWEYRYPVMTSKTRLCLKFQRMVIGNYIFKEMLLFVRQQFMYTANLFKAGRKTTSCYQGCISLVTAQVLWDLPLNTRWQ